MIHSASRVRARARAPCVLLRARHARKCIFQEIVQNYSKSFKSIILFSCAPVTRAAVDELGCYDAWANSTHYQVRLQQLPAHQQPSTLQLQTPSHRSQEQGNYDGSWRFADKGACPACGEAIDRDACASRALTHCSRAGTRGSLPRPGVCTAFGGMDCNVDDGSFNYRCSAKKCAKAAALQPHAIH